MARKKKEQPTKMQVLVAGPEYPYPINNPRGSLQHYQPSPHEKYGLPGHYEYVEHDIEFYAIMQFYALWTSRSGVEVWWKRLDLNHTPHYPMNANGLGLLLARSEFAKPGIVDGKWRLKKHGPYVTIIPVFAEDTL